MVFIYLSCSSCVHISIGWRKDKSVLHVVDTLGHRYQKNKKIVQSAMNPGHAMIKIESHFIVIMTHLHYATGNIFSLSPEHLFARHFWIYVEIFTTKMCCAEYCGCPLNISVRCCHIFFFFFGFFLFRLF